MLDQGGDLESRTVRDASPLADSSSAPTIYDVAKAAGVAPSTVSRAFARPSRVSAATAARITAVAEELGYRANPIARALSTSRTHIIGLVVSDVAKPFYSELIRGVQAAAGEAEYVVLLTDAQESGAREREALERLLGVVEGIVIGSSNMSDPALRTIAKQTPMIVLNRELVDSPSVVTDNAAGAQAALIHLHDLGHRAVTYVAGPEASWADSARWRAIEDAATKLGVHVQRIGPFQPTFEGGMGAGEQFLNAGSSAAIAYNDLVAIGLMAALRHAGTRVPDDFSVVGFDDIQAARLVSPSLTTVAAPMRYMGATAVRNLLSMVRGAKPDRGKAFVMPVKLMIRNSTGQRRP